MNAGNMDNIKINTKTPIDGLYTLNVNEFIERDGELIFQLNNEDYFQINVGDSFTFIRSIKGEGNVTKFYRERVIVLEKDENNLIHTESLQTKKIYLKRNNWYELYYDETTSYYLINCNEEHDFFQQDLSIFDGITVDNIDNNDNGRDLQLSASIDNGYDSDSEDINQTVYYSGQELYLKNYNGDLIGSFKEINAINKYSKQPLTIDDCIVHYEKEKTCDKAYKYGKTYYYVFLPESEDRHSFILNDFNPYSTEDAFYFETKFNVYYYYTINLDEFGNPSELDNSGNPVKHCRFYDDVWFGSLLSTEEIKYVNEGPNVSNLYQDKMYYNVNLAISNDADEVSLGSEDYFKQYFGDYIKESIIPDFIDMERIKYIPYRTETAESAASISTRGGDNPTDIFQEISTRRGPVSRITIYPHFRKRTVLDMTNNTNTFSTSGNLYYDGWYIDTEDEGNQFWNGYDWSTLINNPNDFNSKFSQFVISCGKTADLIGFLNFTDNDIFYKKHKVSKSFFRLSFYNSKNPLDQKLLSYSTVFLDSSELYYKFIKQKMFVEFCEDSRNNVGNMKVEIDNMAYMGGGGNPTPNKNVKIVFCKNNDVNSRVDTKIILTNEYDKTRSAEGFNLYLFAEDIPEGKTSRTIYMRIDFNHAGNGKTIPMIIWPKNAGGEYIPLTIDNFLDNLYIPIKIQEYNGKYIYAIGGADYDENGDIELILFEPKLEQS